MLNIGLKPLSRGFLWFFVELDPVVLNRWLSVIKPAYQGDRNSDLEHFDIEGDYYKIILVFTNNPQRQNLVYF